MLRLAGQFKDFSKYMFIIGIILTILSFMAFAKNEELEICIKYSLFTTISYTIGVLLDAIADIIIYKKFSK